MYVLYVCIYGYYKHMFAHTLLHESTVCINAHGFYLNKLNL